MNDMPKSDKPDARLLAIVSVEKPERVQCGQQGCGHTVYRAIHVVREGTELLVLGSTCFANRYGSAGALGANQYGGGGTGRALTTEERQLLVSNTAELLARFENEALERAQEIALRESLRPARPLPLPYRPPARHAFNGTSYGTRHRTFPPWAWMKPMSSMAYFRLQDGTGWVRVQRNDSKQLLVPWPVFEGWDEAFPASLGTVSSEHGGYLLNDVAHTISYLRKSAVRERVTGIWKEIEAEAT